MYAATMEYEFLDKHFEEGRTAWERIVFDNAKGRKGLVQMRLLTSSPKILAIGVWENQDDAKAFMETGVFIRLRETLDPWLKKAPEPKNWVPELDLQT